MPVKRVEKALEEMRAGRMVILVDDEGRENEGDLCLAAEATTPEAINFMARHGRGLICLALPPEHADRLDLQPQSEINTSHLGTAFTVTVDAREGITTGVSAADRARTIEVAMREDSRPDDLALDRREKTAPSLWE